MQIETTKLQGVLVLTPARFGDARGFFCESWNRKVLAQHGITLDFVQDNHSLSAQVGRAGSTVRILQPLPRNAVKTTTGDTY